MQARSSSTSSRLPPTCRRAAVPELAAPRPPFSLDGCTRGTSLSKASSTAAFGSAELAPLAFHLSSSISLVARISRASLARSLLFALRSSLFALRSSLFALRSSLVARRSLRFALRCLLFALRSSLRASLALCSRSVFSLLLQLSLQLSLSGSLTRSLSLLHSLACLHTR